MGWWTAFGGLWIVVFWGGIITLIVAGIKKLTERGGSRVSPTRKSNPLDVAKERYSKGDFTRGEFEEIKENLS